MTEQKAIPYVSVNYACNGSSKKTNELGMRPCNCKRRGMHHER